jgi:bifunctional DNase/RNase
MNKIELEIVALSHSITQNQSYAVVLGEKQGVRRLPIVIGSFEAQAIAVALEKMSPSRPLTHDLIRNLFLDFNIKLLEIVISNLQEGIFFSQLVCEQNGDFVEIDSRTSDALALAVRFGCPIYTYDFIMDSAGIVLENPGVPTKEVSKKSSSKATTGINELEMVSLKDLQELLNEAIAAEDYEKAASIRDEMQKREAK